MTELSADSTEHELVIAALQPMDPERKCFRLIGDVLVERTVGETLPAVEKTRANLDLMIASLSTQLQQVSGRNTVQLHCLDCANCIHSSTVLLVHLQLFSTDGGRCAAHTHFLQTSSELLHIQHRVPVTMGRGT